MAYDGGFIATCDSARGMTGTGTLAVGDKYKVVYASPWGGGKHVPWDKTRVQLGRYDFETGLWINGRGHKYKNGERVE